VGDWLVITADGAALGRGVRGHSLTWFLQTYCGYRATAHCTPATWRRRTTRADTIFVGLPSTLSAEEIAALDCRRLVAFDYLDSHSLAWTPEQEQAFRKRTDLYWKPWREPSWNYGLRMGLLPIRRYGRFSTAIAMDRVVRRLRSAPKPMHDVAFLGRPNATRFFVDGKVVFVEQRLEWLLDLHQNAADLSFVGGLVKVDPQQRERLESEYGDLSWLWREGGQKANYASYYRSLQQSRVLLAPGGNVPWTYRHYECLYSGAMVVTLDYRERDMLVPLPRDLMVHVPDGASVVPAVREALERSRLDNRLDEQTYAHLEQYFWLGRYSRARKKLWDRFVDQLG